ncbi:MAG: hypothetical protein ABIO61_04865 [Thermomonas sp.]
MRQVFSSQRLENVEAVAELLRKEGIDVRISDGRSYQGNRRSHFSYRDGAESGRQPAVWILKADDQPRGRQLLRDAGLLESTRAGESSYLPLSTLHDKKAHIERKRSSRARVRIGLLVLIVVVSALIWYARRDTPAVPANKPVAAVAPAKPKFPSPAIIPQADDLEIYRADVPTALAKLLVETETAKAKPAQACIAIDGADPAPQFIESLVFGSATQAFAASDCPKDGSWNIAINDYMTDGSGRGHVQLTTGGGKARKVEAERDGNRWEIRSRQ